MHPGSGADFHEGVGYEDDVHSVEHAGQHGVPQPGLALEVEHAHHVLALRVVASDGEHSAVSEH